MADIVSANDYINLNVIDIDDWNDSDEAKRTRIVNVANRTLTNTYPSLIIPDEAVYEFCPVLASAFNDTNKMNQQGIAGFSITGVGSFTFKAAKELEELIPSASISLIEKANDVSLAKKSGGSATVKYSV